MVQAALSRPARTVVASRPYDHVYDPVYTSSALDHQRTLQKSLTCSIHRVPNWQNLFSELGTFPSCSYRFDAGPRQSQIQFSRVLQEGSSHHLQQHVNATGKERYLFFNRPLIPYMQAATTGLVLSPKVYESGDTGPEPVKSRTVATQSIYREESSQTAPYAPDYVFSDQEKPPELFYLKDWLPSDLTRISLHEIEQIEREQARRAFRTEMPPATTDAEFHHRMKLLQEREMQDYKYREDEVVELEKRRLQAIMEAIQAREAQFERRITERMEKIRASNDSNRATVLDKIQRRRSNALRKINLRRMQMRQEISTAPGRDIIQEYSDYGSKVNAPLDRDGKVPAVSINQIAEKQIGALGKDYHSFVTLETSIPARCLTFNVHKPAKVTTSLTRTRKGLAIIQDIDKINDIIQSMKSSSTDMPNPSQSSTNESVVKPRATGRPVTPITAITDLDRHGPMDSAALLIQRLLRGRAVQSEIERGLRDAFSLIEEHMSPITEIQDPVISMEDSTDYIVDYVVGLTISRSSALLRNDFVAQEEIVKLQALVDRATAERSRREAVQTGQRQRQFAARGKLEQRLRGVNEILQVSSSSLVADIKRRALQELSIAMKAQQPSTDATGNATTDARLALDDEQIVANCLESQILPDVESRLQHRQEQLEAAAAVEAVHASILSILMQI